MEKKNLSDVFTTSKMKKQKEVLTAIKKYCMQVSKDDIEEVHANVVEYFELNEKDTYFDANVFWNECKNQKQIKEQKQNEHKNNSAK